MCVLAPRPDGWGYCDVLPTAAHLPYACRLQTPTTSRHALLDSALLPRFNSSGVVQFVVASRSVCPGRLWLRPVRPVLLPGGGSRLILRIMTPCTLTRSSRVGSLAFWSPYGDSPHILTLTHGAFTLRLTCPGGCRSALASGAVLSVLSYYCHTYGVGAYSHHETDHNLADGRAIKKTRSLREPQGHQGRSTDSNLYRHRTGSGGQVT
jgi:hypothetical protein